MAEKEASKAPSSMQHRARSREGKDLFKRMFQVQNSSSASKDASQLSFKTLSYIRRLNDTVRRHWNPVNVYVSLNPLAAPGIAILLSSMLFIMFPQIDIGVSRFFTLRQRFYLSENPMMLWIRDANRILPYIVLPVMIVLLAARSLHRSSRSVPRRALFVVLSYVLGSALTVQVFKNFFSRARPRDVIEFGGTLEFTPAWQFASMCERNCSFPSGEAASAAAFLAVLVFVPRAYRKLVAAMLVPLSIIVALNRVAFGAHFLSDAVLGWLIVCWLMLWLYRKMGLDSDA